MIINRASFFDPSKKNQKLNSGLKNKKLNKLIDSVLDAAF